LTYGEVETDDPFKVLERAETWLPEHPEDAALLLSCARLAARGELYGKARTYLETSISIKPRLEDYQLLGSLMEQLCVVVGRKAKLPKTHTRRWLDRRQGDRRR